MVTLREVFSNINNDQLTFAHKKILVGIGLLKDQEMAATTVSISGILNYSPTSTPYVGSELSKLISMRVVSKNNGTYEIQEPNNWFKPAVSADEQRLMEELKIAEMLRAEIEAKILDLKKSA